MKPSVQHAGLAATGTSPADLVREGRVHRAVYTDPDLFRLERERIFRRAWIFIAHESEIPHPGDYRLCRLAGEEVLLTRQPGGALALLHNRCPHRGTSLVSIPAGHADRLRCPYHAWMFRLDGSLIAVPLAQGYGPQFSVEDPALSVQRVPRVESYRGFIFASHAAQGESLREFLGEMTSALDNMVDRAPAGSLTQVGGTLRMEYRGNWKLFMENATDLVHPGFVHESSVAAARLRKEGLSADARTAQTLQMLLSNGLASPQWNDVPIHSFRAGHAYMGGFYRQGLIAPEREDPVFARYRRALTERHGEPATARILAVDRFNNLIWPNVSVNSRFAVLRELEPVAVDRTIITSRCFRLDGAPEEMLELTLQFLNTASSAASLVASDDLEIFERCQRGLNDSGSDWIDIRRGMHEDRAMPDGTTQSPGTSEITLRAQLGAWQRMMQEAS